MRCKTGWKENIKTDSDMDKVYEKYKNVIYKWHEKIRVNTCMRVYSERYALNSDDLYYVFGIGVSDFLEPDCYDREAEKSYDMALLGDAYEEYSAIAGVIYGNNHVSLDELADLNNRLKEAGAKEVFIHPSFYMSKSPFLIYPMPESEEVMETMYKNAEHIHIHRNDEILIAIKKESDELEG